MWQKSHARTQISAVLIIVISSFIIANGEREYPRVYGAYETNIIGICDHQHNHNHRFHHVNTRQVNYGGQGYGQFGLGQPLNLFSQVAANTVAVLTNVNKQISTAINQLAQPYGVSGQAVYGVGGYGQNQNPYAPSFPQVFPQIPQPHGRPPQPPYGYQPIPQPPPPPPPPSPHRPPPQPPHKQPHGPPPPHGHPPPSPVKPVHPPSPPKPFIPGPTTPKVIPAPPVPPVPPAPAPPTVITKPVQPTPAPPPIPPIVTPSPSVKIPTTTEIDIENVSYDIDIRGEFEDKNTRKRRQLLPNLFNSIGNVVQAGVNLANRVTNPQPVQQQNTLLGGFLQRPVGTQTPGFQQQQPQPAPWPAPQPSPWPVPQQTSPPVPQPPYAPSTANPIAIPVTTPPPQPQPQTAGPAPAEQANKDSSIPELNLQELGNSDYTWTRESLLHHNRVRRDSDAIYFPNDEEEDRPYLTRPGRPNLSPSQGSQSGAQSTSQNVFNGFEQSSGSQSQSQSVQNAMGIFNQNSAGSTSGNIAVDGSSGQLSAANTMQQSFETADSSGSKNSAQSQSANFDKNGNLALTSSNANTNSVREKDRFKEQSNAGSSSTLQNQFGSSSSNAQTDSETFFENGVHGSKNSASSQSQQTNKDGSFSGSNSNAMSNTFTGPNGLQGSSASSQSSSVSQGIGGGGTSSSASSSSSSGNGGSFSISGSFSGLPGNVFPFKDFFQQLKG